MGQIQCPHCAGWKVTARPCYCDAGARQPTYPAAGCLGSLAGALLIAVGLCWLASAGCCLASGAFALWLFPELPPPGQAVLWVLVIGLVGLIPVILGLSLVLALRRRQRAAYDPPDAYHYTCEICGYEWTWEPGLRPALPPAGLARP
jgi:hypothetical protein